MHLKSIEMIGFKSFPDKIDLTFPDGITCVVGPNGSGKSNISDAIRWVMGEQSVKTLRGGKMEDVIFSGTEKRKPLAYCEVSLTVDNSDKALPIEYDEVLVTRRILRSGETEYYINGSVCRLKDIHELFMDTGLGKDGYSLVGQGRIDEIISGKPSERRSFFEEACGISKFRHRKDDAERKLNNTENNILRINDIVGELETQLEPLKVQAEKAKKYLVFRDELKDLEINSWLHSIDKSKESLDEVNKLFSNSKTKLIKAQNTLEELDSEMYSLNEQSKNLQDETDRLIQENHNMAYSIKTFEGQIEISLNNTEHKKDEITRLETEKKEIQKNIDELKNFTGNSQEQLDKFNENVKSIKSEISELQAEFTLEVSDINKELSKTETAEQEFNKRKKELEEKSALLEKEKKELEEKKISLTEKYLSCKNKGEVLSDIQNDYSAFPKSVKEIMTNPLPGTKIYGTVSDLLSVSKEHAKAIDAALAGAAVNIVCETEYDAKKYIEFLKEKKAGRATFLPLSSIKPQPRLTNLEKENGFVGVATDLISCDEKFRIIFENLLNKIAVVNNIDNAIKMTRKHNHSFKAVTLDGEIFNIGGSITGGTQKNSVGAVGRNAEIEELKQKTEDLRKKLADVNEELKNIGDKLSIYAEENKLLDGEFSTFNNDKINLLARLKEKENELNLKIKDKNTEIEFISKDRQTEKDKLTFNEERIRLYEKEIKLKDTQIEKCKTEILDLKDEVDFRNSQIADLNTAIDEGNKKIEANRLKKKETEELFEQNQEKSKKERDRLIKLNEEHSRLEVRLSKFENEIDGYINNLWESYELTVTTALEYKKEIDIPKANKRISELKSKMKALGNINIDAIEEYQKVNERYTFLTGQRDDLEKAKADLMKIISEMLKLMKDIFREQFTLIGKEFNITFKELFGGGKAELKLQDEEDILNSGIEIIVQPPGKKLTNITLLSGGEKAFCAIALLFAIINVKPTPFCLFDEIEAALDDVNVYRYASYLTKHKKTTQFIVITHRRGTMEAADTLYGVTMQEKGVSKLLSLNIDEVEEQIK
ncbi:MAG: chromosome segregation protein SMC [Clostridia bacterium]|nr:chromosome segregation protein SMC [Clostridia bacterium]